MERFQEGALEEDPGRNGAVTLINSTLSNMQSFIRVKAFIDYS